MTILELVEEYLTTVNPTWSDDECRSKAFDVYHNSDEFNAILDQLLVFKTA